MDGPAAVPGVPDGEVAGVETQPDRGVPSRGDGDALERLEDPRRLAERRGESTVARPPGPLVWVHGASVGEVAAIIPLVERIASKDLNVLVTSGTVGSAKLCEQRLPAGVIHQFVPWDTPRFIARFLDHWKPNLALFTESDLLPNTIVCTLTAVPRSSGMPSSLR